ncbi:unnamed protein product, partial [Choristocarpus tenellus]
GIISRSIFTILKEATARRDQGCEFALSASYVEIYNERVRDLLRPKNNNMKVLEHPGEGFVASGAQELLVTCLDDARHILAEGSRHRTMAPTLMNKDSSRSHSIMTLRLDQACYRTTVRNCDMSGRLVLVDLAGSERVSRTRAEGLRLKEANRINVSLTTLGMVIKALTEAAPHVPYRDSKLTRLLQESLGGNSR